MPEPGRELDECLLGVAGVVATLVIAGNDFQEDLDRLTPDLAEIASRVRNAELIEDSRAFMGVHIGNLLLQHPKVMGSLREVRGRAEAWFDQVLSHGDVSPDVRAGGVSDAANDASAVQLVRTLARDVAADPRVPPEPCNGLNTRTVEVQEPAKGLFKRSRTVERPAAEVTETHFDGWLLWKRKQTSRTYVQPFSVEESSREIWLTSEGKLMLVEISSGGAYFEGKGQYPYRRVEESRRAPDEDRLGCTSQEMDRGATPAIMHDTAWVPYPSSGDPGLAELTSSLRSLSEGGLTDE